MSLSPEEWRSTPQAMRPMITSSGDHFCQIWRAAEVIVSFEFSVSQSLPTSQAGCSLKLQTGRFACGCLLSPAVNVLSSHYHGDGSMGVQRYIWWLRVVQTLRRLVSVCDSVEESSRQRFISRIEEAAKITGDVTKKIG
ncbi:hypothetical protein AKJ16_DCAP02767 [Drosera capensis]